MALESIQLTTVYIHNQDAALDFYTNKLGMEKRIDNVFGPIRFLVVAPKGSTTGLVLQAAAENSKQPGGNTSIVLGSSDVEGTYQELHSRGVTFPQKPTAQPWGAVQALFSDLDGNIFVLQNN